MSVNPSQFTVPQALIQSMFYTLAVPFWDPVTKEYDLDGLKDAFDATMGNTAHTIKDLVLQSGGNSADVEEAVQSFIHSVQASFRTLQ